MTAHPGGIGRSYASTEEQRARYEAQMRYEAEAMRDDDPLDTAAGKPCAIGGIFLWAAGAIVGVCAIVGLWSWICEVLA